ncbi:CotH protein [Novipirellula aureliae]|uniref:CotH protein n=1 Tax=Novipirellula aureliae TaxID=2527966 RepID=A0A5C6DQI0_9BACT|nr:lamin tail domain-containing protein [Novipirellula aureliae]TWU39090.1 CotH protein [Novipirellula aureliae]
MPRLRPKKTRLRRLETLEKRQLLAADFQLTEFLASNGSSLTDSYGRSSDWVEIRNIGDMAGDLEGWSLTDDADELDQWTFPDTPQSELAAGEFLVVFASGDGTPEPSSGELHTNFKLSADGEYLALVRPDGQVANEFGSATSDYPEQFQDISYGIDPSVVSGNAHRYFSTPTPGSVNGVGVEGFVEDTTFSLDRGFYTAPIVVNVTSATTGATIVYTTDGSTPTLSNGTAVFAGANTSPTASVPITTTTLRAAAFKTGLLATNVDTQSYFYLNDVVDQPADPSGFPNKWGSANADYEVDPDIANAEVLTALMDLPTLSLTADVDDIFGTDGIYSNPREEDIEIASSVEWILADGSSGFQIDAGLQISGGASRIPTSSPKHSMSLRFRSEYGAGRLNYPLFDDAVNAALGGSAVTEFNSLQLRAVYNNSWVHNNAEQRERATMIRDQFIRDSMIAMGNDDGGRGTYANLYLNGLYWGVYNVHERPEASHYAAYHGGDDDRIDALNGGTPVDGTIDSYNALQAAAAAKDWDEVTERLDVDNFIDFTIINAYGGNSDIKPHNNWRAAGGGLDDAKWRMYAWDSERTLEGVDGTLPSGMVDPTEMLADLSEIPEFVVRFGDRLHMHFSEGGALTPAANQARFNARVDELQDAIAGESARWGDYRVAQQPYTKEAEWTTEINRLINEYFPDRSDLVLDDYKTIGLYPNLEAPKTLIDSGVQVGGPVDPGSELTFSASVGSIYYTTDGSDPRLAGGSVNPDATLYNHTNQREIVSAGASWMYDDTGTDLGTAWQFSSYDDSAWSMGDAELGYGESDEATVISYGADPADKFPTAYFRKTITVTEAFDALALQLKVDDGAVVYINGVEAARMNMPTGSIDYSTGASNAAADDGNTFTGITLDPNLLVVGNNVIAIEVHQVRSMVNGERTGPVGSSDFSFDAALVGATSVDDPIVLNQSVQIRTRAVDTEGEWSALQASDFVVAGAVADATNFRITEINYHPHEVTDAEIDAVPGSVADDFDFEFIEVMNTSASEAISLSGLRLANAVEFEFDDVVLAPMQRAVVVADAVSFATRYGSSADSPILVLGTWSGSLKNSSEEIQIIDESDNVIMAVEYIDSDPWPIAADGSGGTLSLIDPLNTPADQLEKPYRWAVGGVVGGSPGGDYLAPQGIIINEILSHTDAPQSDSIELLNASDQVIDISGWWLSDSGDELLKYQIPTIAALQPGEVVVFDEEDFNVDPALPGQVSFALNGAEGEEVYLTQAVGGVVTRIEDAVEFGATFNGMSLGRIPDTLRLVPLQDRSLGFTNGDFAFSDVVISELNYHPGQVSQAALDLDPSMTPSDLEFIELTNRTGSTIDLTDWRLRGEADFDFATGQLMASGQSLVVTTFDPSDSANESRVAAFKAQFGIGETVVLVGPFSGSLSNNHGVVKLQSPDEPPLDDPGITPHINVDELFYDDLAPWPVSADGSGNSLNRIDPSPLGADASSWEAATPTPGTNTLSLPDQVVRLRSYGRQFNRRNSTWGFQAFVVNTTPDTFSYPMRLLIKNLEPAGAVVANPDGVLSDGTPYFEILGEGTLSPGGFTDSLVIAVETPGQSGYNFDGVLQSIVSSSGSMDDGNIQQLALTSEEGTPPTFHNDNLDGDVNRDGKVTALDALNVINHLAQQETLVGEEIAGIMNMAASPLYDVSNDGEITALDALLVINQLSQQPSSAVVASTLGEAERNPLGSDQATDIVLLDFFEPSTSRRIGSGSLDDRVSEGREDDGMLFNELDWLQRSLF